MLESAGARRTFRSVKAEPESNEEGGSEVERLAKALKDDAGADADEAPNADRANELSSTSAPISSDCSADGPVGETEDEEVALLLFHSDAEPAGAVPEAGPQTGAEMTNAKV